MGKILFWFVVIVVILFGARLLARSGGSGRQQKPTGKLGKAAASPPDMSHAESMVRCAHCGIHMPRSEAFLSDGRTWCGAQHAKLGQRQP